MLLLDEAFSALDRNLREEMQLELSLLLRRLGVTAILVTHDQREAFALADRIAVMETGRIAQIGRPQEVYQKPQSSHVLRFLGTTNALRAALMRMRPACTSGSPTAFPSALPQRPVCPDSGPATVYLRAEDVTLMERPTAVHAEQPATVTLATFLGAQERIVVTLGGQQIVVERPAHDGAAQRPLVPGQAVFLAVRPGEVPHHRRGLSTGCARAPTRRGCGCSPRAP